MGEFIIQIIIGLVLIIIGIFLGFSVEEGWGTTEGMCVPIKDIEMIYKGFS